MAELTHVPRLVLKWVLSCKAPKTSKDVAKHFCLHERTAGHYLRLLTNKGFLKLYHQKNRCNYYGNPTITPPPPELEKEPVVSKPVKKKKPTIEPVLPNVVNPSKLEDVWGRVVRG